MSTFPWLTVTGAIPLVGTLAVAAIPAPPADSPADNAARDLLAKRLALVFSLATLVISVVMAVQFKTSGPRFQFTEDHSWIPQFGIHYALGADGIALVLILMTTVLMPLIILASWNDAEGGRRSVKTYFALLLIMETMVIGVFAATDVFLFYVFFEAMLIPMYFLIGSYGVGQRQYAAVKFLLYSLLGGLLMLVAVIALYVYSAHGGAKGTFLFSSLVHVTLGSEVQKWLFLGFFIAFAIKAPLWPFHTWLPDAASSAQPGAAVLLVGVLDKVGTFGMLRYCLELFPQASRYFTPLVITLSVIGILYGAIVAIGQTNLMRLIAYSSLSHFGFIALGVFVLTTQGQVGATLYMVNHAFSTGALFLIVGFMIVRRGSQRIADYGGVQKVAPVLAGLFLVSGLSALALPGLNTFVSEFLVLVGTFTRYKTPGVLATLATILAAIYILWMYQRTMNGPTQDEVKGMPDLKARELWAVGPLVALIVVLGIYPKPVIDVISPAVRQTMAHVHATDPAPAIGNASSGTAAGQGGTSTGSSQAAARGGLARAIAVPGAVAPPPLTAVATVAGTPTAAHLMNARAAEKGTTP